MKNDIADLLEKADRQRDSGALDEALASYQEAVAAFPEAADAHYRLGTAFSRLRQQEEEEDCYRRALDLQPDHPEAANNLGAILARRVEWGEAELLYRRALAQRIDYFEPHLNLGYLLADTNRIYEAQYYFGRALALRPDSAVATERLGQMMRRLGKNSEALPWLKRAIELDEASPSAWNNLAICQLHGGDFAAAEKSYQKALQCDPKYFQAWDGLLLMTNYLGRDERAIFDLHRAYGREMAPQTQAESHSNSPDPARRLRIGFVSGDLRRHSVSYFIEGIFSRLNRSQFELWVYFSHPNPDQRTEHLRRFCYGWRFVHGRSDSELAKQIRDDRIDILVDLAGHTGYNRLLAFAEKPAPVQVSWIGYPNTTGLPQIDYRLSDSLADPEGVTDQYYVEKLWRLPESFLCYTPPTSAPMVADAPCLSKGHITFGSFNNRVKIGPACIDLWSKVLKAVPDSRLLIKSALGLEEQAMRDALLDSFVELGIARERVTAIGAKGSLEDHLAMYADIDIALDSYPYHGTTTTCEALWMGVPVVTKAGERHASRVGISILTNAGLGDLIAETDEEYVEIACQLAADFSTLSKIRSALREVLKTSRLLDEQAMARDFGAALRSMWKIYCENWDIDIQSVVGDAVPDANIDLASRLIIGGETPQDGWQIFAAQPGDGIDFDGDLADLTRFGDDSYAELYCCHVLQRIGQGDIVEYLIGLHRILRPGGKLYLSVPDLDTLSWLMCSPLYSKADKFQLMRMLFGRQLDYREFNCIGLTADFLSDYLKEAGFSLIEHVESFGMFDDASETRVDSMRVSLNLVVTK